MKVPLFTNRDINKTSIPLEDNSKIVVVGGGPAGSFFATTLLKKAKKSGRRIEVTILEKKKEPLFYEATCSIAPREGCNYCAGGISPRMSDVLEELRFTLPNEILESTVKSLTIQGHWKNIEIKVPEGRKMFTVYRGSRPKGRSRRHANFDSFLLEQALSEGARVITGKVNNIQYSNRKTPLIHYEVIKNGDSQSKHIEADFLVFAGGVNPTQGKSFEKNGLLESLQRLFPGFSPPKVRKTLIFELEAEEEFIRKMEDEVYFIEYGSSDLKIAMSSLMPKGRFITVALIGPSIDNADPSENFDIINKFLEVPHMKRLFPEKTKISTACACNPNMTIGAAKKPFGFRTAIIGDMVTSRLYKDGILSAYFTASSLANTILDIGVDTKSLKRGYWPTIKQFKIDNFFGRIVFLFNQITFSKPILSRMYYQAVMTERKKKPKHKRRLEQISWRIASGDDTYKDIFLTLFHPYTLFYILIGGVWITIRNYITEFFFGLKWHDLGRYPTGVYKETLESKRKELIKNLDLYPLKGPLDLEKMYSIRIKADKNRIFHQLGLFGDKEMVYFKPKIIRVHRISGAPNEIGNIIQYSIPIKLLSFSLILERILGERYIVYRVMDGFAKGGILVFNVEEIKVGVFFLSIYVAFNFPRSKNTFERLSWNLFKFFFPKYLHDVLWNHSLCKIKDIAETGVR